MKLKKLLTLSLAAALLIGGVVTANAAELDTAWYAAKNPDVVAALGNSPKALRQHYQTYGRKEGRMANDHDVEAQLRKLFKAEEYAALYPDVKAVFGENTEMMFQHYISYGLLEARRPSEKVSQAAAATLKTTIEKAMTDAGVEVKPGSAKLVEVITGTISADKGGAAVRAALTQAAPAVEKAVAAAVTEATAPAPTPAASSGGGSSSSSSSSAGSSSSSNTGTTTPEPENPSSIQLLVYTDVICNDSVVTDLGDSVTEVEATYYLIITYKGSVTPQIAKKGTNKIGDNYWYAVAVPKTAWEKEGPVYQLLLDGGMTTNVTDNMSTIADVDSENYYIFGISNNGSGGTVYFALSSEDTNVSDDGIMFEINIAFEE